MRYRSLWRTVEGRQYSSLLETVVLTVCGSDRGLRAGSPRDGRNMRKRIRISFIIAGNVKAACRLITVKERLRFQEAVKMQS